MAHQNRGGPAQSHVVYVAQTDSKGTTRQIAAYISSVKPLLRNRGIKVEVYEVRSCDLQNPRVLRAFRARGIRDMPAALTGAGPLIGLRAIREHYDACLQPPPSRSQPAPAARNRNHDDPTDETQTADEEANEDLDAFYRQEMRVGRLGAEIDVSAEFGDPDGERRV